MKPKKIGLLYGMERSFPKAVAERINELGRGAVVAEPVIVDGVRLDLPLAYDLILDRISQDIPFYRTMLKYAVLRGTGVVNNPFWWTCEDKFSANAIGVAARGRDPQDRPRFPTNRTRPARRVSRSRTSSFPSAGRRSSNTWDSRSS